MLITKAAYDVQFAAGPLDPVAAAIEWHDGDIRATIWTPLADCVVLHKQIDMAELAMSAGFLRGWSLAQEREAWSDTTPQRKRCFPNLSTTAFRQTNPSIF
jgi:hypothetical protein